MKRLNLLILRNEDPYDHLPWVKACEEYKNEIDYKIVDITRNDWLENITSFNPDLCLLKPSGKTSLFRFLYQERIDILVHDLKIPVFPSYNELRIYENKRFFSYWAKANNVPHPKTFVFYNKKEALNSLKYSKTPLVGKLNIGASGSGIKILHNRDQLNNYIKKAFHSGLRAQTGPKLQKGNLIHRLWHKLLNPKKFINRIQTYKSIASDKQKGFVIIQEYIPHNYEWRVVRIGDSFFAHKKIVTKDKASGTLLKNYDNPPLNLFDFTKSLTDKFGLHSVAVDLFEKNNNEYLVNEIQCIFGQSDPYQMLVNGKPGRYRYKEKQWEFEEGDFNKNKSFNLRLEYILSNQF